MIERIRESFRVRPIAVSKARIIGRDKTIAIGEPGEERLEHSRRRRESVQQEKRRRVFRTGLSIKDGEPIYLYRAIKSRVFHGTFLVLGQQLDGCEHHSGGAGNEPHFTHEYFSVEARSVPRALASQLSNHPLSTLFDDCERSLNVFHYLR